MKKRKISIQAILILLVGVFCTAVGVAFNASAGLGNDPIGMLYDGIRCAAGLSAAELGMASNIVNITLFVVMLIIGRRYISIGTLVYFIPYGVFVDIGYKLYSLVAITDTYFVRVLLSVIGCLILYLGVAICIVVDIGVDPCTGIVLVIRDWVKKEYRIIKIAYDITIILIGAFLGGTLGVVTVITAFAGGPIIQFYCGILEKLLGNILKK